MRVVLLVALALALVACSSPYRVEGEVRGEVDVRLVEKGTDNELFSYTFEEDGTIYFDGRWAHVEYLSGKTWSFDVKARKEVASEVARSALGLP
jgi:hypothetical protein